MKLADLEKKLIARKTKSVPEIRKCKLCGKRIDRHRLTRICVACKEFNDMLEDVNS